MGAGTAARGAENIASSPVIIELVSRSLSAALAGIAFLAGCGRSIQNKEKVQQAILERLGTRSGLDLKSLDVTTTSVSFDRNLAFATVAFHPKSDTNVSSGMLMKYTLENQHGKWVVIRVGDSQGHAGLEDAGTTAGQLPPGHPPVNSIDPHQMPAPPPAGSERTQ